MEATVRYAAELGYDVTLIKDATADYSDEEMHAALDVNLPNYASAIVTTDEIVASIVSSASVLRDSKELSGAAAVARHVLWARPERAAGGRQRSGGRRVGSGQTAAHRIRT